MKHPVYSTPEKLTRTQEMPLPEVSNKQELTDKLATVVNGQIPGFVIRSVGLTDVSGDDHKSITDAVLKSLNEQDGLRYRIADLAKPLNILPEIGTGQMHTDIGATACGIKSSLNVHTTALGTGQVYLAMPGQTLQEHSAEYHLTGSVPNDNWIIEHVIGTQFRNGQIDPCLVSYLYYTAMLQTGDTTVFSFESPAGPTLHRFDTDTSPRMALSSQIEAVQA